MCSLLRQASLKTFPHLPGPWRAPASCLFFSRFTSGAGHRTPPVRTPLWCMGTGRNCCGVTAATTKLPSGTGDAAACSRRTGRGQQACRLVGGPWAPAAHHPPGADGARRRHTPHRRRPRRRRPTYLTCTRGWRRFLPLRTHYTRTAPHHTACAATLYSAPPPLCWADAAGGTATIDRARNACTRLQPGWRVVHHASARQDGTNVGRRLTSAGAVRDEHVRALPLDAVVAKTRLSGQ